MIHPVLAEADEAGFVRLQLIGRAGVALHRVNCLVVHPHQITGCYELLGHNTTPRNHFTANRIKRLKFSDAFVPVRRHRLERFHEERLIVPEHQPISKIIPHDYLRV